jgi:Fic family protein
MASVENVLRDLKAAGEPIKHTAKDLAELAKISEDEARIQLAKLDKEGLLKRKDDMTTKDSPVPLRVMGFRG